MRGTNKLKSILARGRWTLGLIILLATSLWALPPDFTKTNIMPSLTRGTSIVQLADGRLLMTELGGALKTYKDGAFSTIHTFPTSTQRSEQGLFGLAADPNYASNGYLYVHYFVYVNGGNQDYHVIQRITVDPPLNGTPQLVPGSQRLVYRLPNLPDGASRHNGGMLVFGNDGYLWMPKGDGERQEQADNMQNVFGKLIRIDVHSTSASNDDVNGHYGIPAGNAGLARPEVFATGFRNPWSMAKDPQTGDIYIGDVGGQEEVNRVIPGQHSGKKFGWGPGGNSGMYNCADAAFVCPMITYGGGAITGVAPRRGNAGNWPSAYANTLFYSDHNGNWIKYAPIGQNSGTTFDADGHQPLGMMFGNDGNLYYARYNGGGLWMIRYEGAGDAPPAITSHPANATISSGRPVSFSVAATGPNLAYQWQTAPTGGGTFTNLANNAVFSGATTATLTIQATESQAAQYRVRVSNATGAVHSNAATLTVLPPNASPTLTFTSPAQGSNFTVGQAIDFSATAADPEQGQLPASAFRWEVEMGHRTGPGPNEYHTHPVTFYDGIRNGTMTGTVAGETAPDVWLLLILTVTDNVGNTDKDTLLLYPNKTTLRGESDPPGLTVVVMDPKVTPFDMQAAIGNDGKINANTPQILNGKRWIFDHWSFSGDVPPELNTTSVFQNFHVRPGQATFRAHYVEDPTYVPNIYALRAVDNEYVALQANNTLIPNAATAGAPATVFEIGDNADNTQYIRSTANNMYCRITAAGADITCDAANVAGNESKWVRLDQADGKTAFRNLLSNQHMVAEGGGTGALKANRGGISDWEKFTVVSQASNPPPTTYGITMAVAAGTGATSPAAGTVTQVIQGGNLAITATPGAGFTFSHWTATAGLTLSGTTTASAQVSGVSQAGTVSAHFTAVQNPPQGLIALRAVDNEFVALQANNTLIPNAASAGAAATVFELGANADNTQFIKSTANNLYCRITTAGADITCDAASVTGNESKWVRLDQSDGKTAFRNLLSNQHMVAEGGGTGALKANRGGIGGWEKFTVVAQSSNPPTTYGITMAVAAGTGATSPAAGTVTQVAQGGNLSITAAPGAGFTFSHWTATAGLTLSSTTAASSQVTGVSQAGTVSAHFTAVQNPPQSGLFAFRAVDNEYVALQANNTLIPNAATAGAAATVFEIGTNADNSLFIKSTANNLYCRIAAVDADITCDAASVTGNEAKWNRLDQTDGKTAFQNLLGNGHMVSEGGGTGALKANRAGISDWEKFTVSTQGTPPQTTQYAINLEIETGQGTLVPAARSVTMVNQGANLSISATPAAGYVFAHWHATAGLVLASTTNPNTQVMSVNANGTVSAHFEAAPPQSSQTLQAESGTISGAVVAANQAGYRGTGFVDYVNAANDYLQWSVTVSAAGQYQLAFRYALQAGNRPLKLTVNGVDIVASLAFPSTGGWAVWNSVTANANLVAGANTIRLTAIGSSGGNIDELTVTGGSAAKRAGEEAFQAAFSMSEAATFLGLRRSVHSLSSGGALSIGLLGTVDDRARLDFRLLTPTGREAARLRAPADGRLRVEWDLGGAVQPGLYYYQLRLDGLAPLGKNGKLLLLP